MIINMRNKLITLVVISGLSVATLNAQELLDNGGFEDGTGSGTTRSFDVTSNWYNRGTSDQNQVARRESTDTGSSFVGQINDRYDVITATSDFDSAALGTITHSQKTSYIIEAGDAFDFSYEWTSLASWNSGLDEVRLVVFATDDNTLGGAILWSSIADSGTATVGNLTYEGEAGTTGIVAAAATGKALFVNIYGFQNNDAMSGSAGFARIDNLSVTSTVVVPEPNTYALLAGTCALGFVMLRRQSAC
jgi:hypothetical protein